MRLRPSMVGGNAAAGGVNSAAGAELFGNGRAAGGQSGASTVNSISNGYLLLQEQNSILQRRNNDLLIAGNRPGSGPSSAAPAKDAEVVERFFFDLPAEPAEGKPAGEFEKLESLMPLEKSNDKRDSEDDAKKEESEAKSQESLNRFGSQLLERGRRQAGKGIQEEAPATPAPAAALDAVMPENASEAREQQMPQFNVPRGNSLPQAGGGMGSGDGEPFADAEEQVADWEAPVSTGLLSLEFLIPQDGTRMDFTRPEGNAALTLDVRGSKAVSHVYSLLWAAVCAVSAFIVLRGARSASKIGFFEGLSCVLAVASLSGYLILSTELAIVCLAVFIVSSISLCVLYIISKRRSRESAAA